jgi:hypothetical protein
MPPAPPKPPPRLPTMVGWYDPRQLLETARQTILADIFGGRADFRLHEAGRGGELALDYRERVDEHGALWIDYVSDVGDGFDSTYSVARAVAAPALTIAAGGPGGTPLTLPRGQLLILGGDQVYPTPDDDGYLRRMVDPYEMALPAAPGEPVPADVPHLLALPGNHDWYDGLQSFVKVFCRRTRVGGWVTPQARSYFALQLPHQTWLFGLDTQLNGDLDETQLGFFSSQKVQAGQRVIFCLPEPQWLMANPYDCSTRLPNNLVRLLDHLALNEIEVPLLMAGDLHHYRRHSRGPEVAATAAGTRHLVTAGGGGAFLHPTHTRPRGLRCCYHGERSLRRLRCKLTLCRASDQKARCLAVRFGRTPSGEAVPLYPLAQEYPSARRSWRHTLENFVFPLRNPLFGLATAILYLALAWVMPPPLPAVWAEGDTLTEAILAISAAGLADLTAAPARMLLFLLVLLAFWAFTDTHRKAFRAVAAIAHGGAHLLAALVVTLAARQLVDPISGLLDEQGLKVVLTSAGERLASWSLILVGGYVAGSVIMGLYLLISCAVFGRHGNEAFSSLRIADHKHFLRLRLDARGLQVFVVALHQVTRFKLADGRLVECRPGSAPVIIDRFEVPPPAGSGAPG